MPSFFAPLYWLVYIVSARIGVSARFALTVRAHPEARRRPLIVAAKHTSYWDVPILSRAVRTRLRQKPYFEMGSFHGYPVIGRLRWALRACGGFEVMRGKDLMRLKASTGKSRAELRKIMEGVNDKAAGHRRVLLERGGTLCFFPEGTRNPEGVRPLKARLEIDEAVAYCTEHDIDAWLVPAGIRRWPLEGRFIPFFRRARLVVDLGAPIALRGASVEDVLETIRDHFEALYAEP